MAIKFTLSVDFLYLESKLNINPLYKTHIITTRLTKHLDIFININQKQKNKFKRKKENNEPYHFFYKLLSIIKPPTFFINSIQESKRTN